MIFYKQQKFFEQTKNRKVNLPIIKITSTIIFSECVLNCCGNIYSFLG